MTEDAPDTLESMPMLAAIFVDAMTTLGEERIDYSASSIEFVDAHIEAWWPARRPWRLKKASRSSARDMVPVIGPTSAR